VNVSSAWIQRLLVAALLSATIASAFAVQRITTHSLASERADRVKTARNHVSDAVKGRAFYLEDLADMVGVHDDAAAEEFSRYAHVRGRNESSIVSVQWVRRSPKGKLVAAAPEDPDPGRTPMLVAPSQRANSKLAHAATASAAASALRKAAFNKQVSISAPIRLANGHSAFYLAVPVEARAFTGLLSHSESQSAIVGLVDAQNLVATAIAPAAPVVRVSDHETVLGATGSKVNHAVIANLPVAGHAWTVSVEGGSLSTLERLFPWLILIIGGALSAAVALALRGAARRRDAALNLAAERLTNIERANSELKEAHARAENHARIDSLTNIFNRRHFTEILATELQNDDGVSAAVLLMDLDHFKKVNDEYGHLIGDAVLRAAAARLASILRPSDCLARWGGEEFAILAPGLDRPGMQELAERARGAIGASRITIDDISFELTVSVGAALTNPKLRTTPDEIVDAADQALYEAKHAGRDCIRLSAPHSAHV
jgi:diguanylate cyclase (GGDEF)-like protein